MADMHSQSTHRAFSAWTAAAISLAAICSVTCSTAPKARLSGLGEGSLQACPGWSAPLNAHISHVSVSADGSRVFASSSGEKGKFDAKLRAFTSQGNLVWSRPLAQPVKSQSVSHDGKILAINTYDGKLQVFDGTGKKLWEKDHLGRPVVLSRSKRIVLLNDDDAEPRSAFFSYDYAGELKADVAVTTTSDKSETLDFAISPDESSIAVLMSDDTVFIYDPDGRPIWRHQLPKPVVAILPASNGQKKIFALLQDSRGSPHQFFNVVDESSSAALQVDLNRHHYQTMRVAGDSVFFYANGREGQRLAVLGLQSKKIEWETGFPIQANDSSLVFSQELPTPRVIMALDPGATAGLLHVMAIEANGRPFWDAPIQAPSGIYSFSVAQEAKALVVGAGEPGHGVLEYFTFEKTCPLNR